MYLIVGMPKQVVNYDNIVLPELDRFSERTYILEDQSNKNKRFIDRKALEWESTVSELRRELNIAKLEIKSVAAHLIDTKKLFINLVNVFKDTALDDDFRRLKHTIDDWHVDKFITRKEFKKLLKDSIE